MLKVKIEKPEYIRSGRRNLNQQKHIPQKQQLKPAKIEATPAGCHAPKHLLNFFNT